MSESKKAIFNYEAEIKDKNDRERKHEHTSKWVDAGKKTRKLQEQKFVSMRSYLGLIQFIKQYSLFCLRSGSLFKSLHICIKTRRRLKRIVAR
jgi:hypothetical protein